MFKKIGLLISILLFFNFCSHQQEKAITIPQAIPKPLDLILLLDHSSSMKETDPQNNRIAAAKFLVDYLASYWAREQDHRIGLVNFGDLKPPNPEDELAGLISLDLNKLSERQRLVQKIKPFDLRYTKFIDAFKTAYKLFQEAEKDVPRQRAIIILTDGEPDDQRRLTREGYFHEIINFYNEDLKDCYLCVIGIDKNNQYWDLNKPYWDKIAKHTQRITSAGEKELKETFWRIISLLMEAEVDKWDVIPAEGLKFNLDPYLEMVTFTIHKELPEAEVSIYDPKEVKITEKPPQIIRTLKSPRAEIWRIDEPEAGTWLCKIDRGKGKVEVGTTKVPVQPRVIYPREIHPQGKPFVLWTSFLRKDGKPIKEHHAYQLKMWADLKMPDGALYHLDLSETQQIGLFRAGEEIQTEKEGVYQITLHMKAHKELAESVFPIKVIKIPYIDVQKPKPEEVQPWRKTLALEAEVRSGKDAIYPTDIFTDNPNALIFYQIIDLDNNEVLKSGHLQYLGGEKEPKFAISAGKIRKNGRYQINMLLRGRLKNGQTYEYSTEHEGIIISKKMDLADILIYKPYIIFILVLLGLLIWDWQRILKENEWKFWRIACPTLSGELTIIKQDQEPLVITLKGRIKRLKEMNIILIAKKTKDFNQYGEMETRTRIFVFEENTKREEELVPDQSKVINDNTTIYLNI